MEWKNQFKFRELGFRDTCIVLLLLAVNLFILLLISSGPNPKAVSAAYRAHCAVHQRNIYLLLQETAGEEGFELPPDWTVADLIREAVGKARRASHPITEKDLSCQEVIYGRAIFHLRRKRREVIQPYLIFPVAASVVFDESLQKPVPILMCPPGAHGKLGSNVLYSDGTVKSMTAEEAERIVAELSPVPLEIGFEAPEEEKQIP